MLQRMISVLVKDTPSNHMVLLANELAINFLHWPNCHMLHFSFYGWTVLEMQMNSYFSMPL
jgi:hypothetical protein